MQQIRVLRPLTLFMSLFISLILFADNGEVPVGKQTEVLLKMLKYNNALSSIEGNSLRIGIIYTESNAKSMNDYEQIGNSLFDLISAGEEIQSKKITFSGIGFTNAANLKTQATNLNVAVLYVTPGNDANVAAISEVAASSGILTFSAVKSYLTQGIASGVEMVGDNPKIVINLPSAKAQGAKFSAQLLQIANVLR